MHIHTYAFNGTDVKDWFCVEGGENDFKKKSAFLGT